MKKTIVLASVGVFMLAALCFPHYASAARTSNFEGTITAISGTTPPATLLVTANSKSITINVLSTTKLLRKSGGPSDLTEFMIGDTVTITGKPLVAADTYDAIKIRDNSIQRNGGTFVGTTGDLNCAANTFKFTPNKRVEQTVYVTSTTKILRHGEKIGCADLKKGERAVIIGLWRPTQNRIDADRIIVTPDKVAGKITNITIATSSAPATMTVLRNGKNETWSIVITAKTHIQLKGLSSGNISRFKVGDTVEAIGVARPVRTLNAIAIRNLTRQK